MPEADGMLRLQESKRKGHSHLHRIRKQQTIERITLINSRGNDFPVPHEATKKVQKKCKFSPFCIAILELFCIFVMQTNKVTNHLILNAMEKDNRKRVDVYNVTSNGYSFHLKRNGDCSVFCRKDESYRRNTPLQKAISEIIRWARTSGIYFFQWHLEHPF